MADHATSSDARASQYNLAFQRAVVVWTGVWVGVWVGIWFYCYPPPTTRRVTRGCDSSDNPT